MARKKQPKPKPNRVRPRVSLTLDPEVYERLKRVQNVLPGATLSGVVNELLGLSLPMLEDLGRALRESVREDGSVDSDLARDRLAHWAGAQLLDLSDTIHAFGREEPTP